jgi:hypothetical protein
MSLIDRYSPVRIEEITELHPADARAIFASLAAEQAEEDKRHQEWAQKSKAEKAAGWVLKMSDAYRQVVATGDGSFEAHWILDDDYHKTTFEGFNEMIATSPEGMDDTLRLLDVENGICLLGRATMDPASPEKYHCVWYQTVSVDKLGDIALRLPE